jgi:cytochrome P450
VLGRFSEEIRRNPYPAYDRLRAGSPVLHLAPFDLWMILDYDGVRRALPTTRYSAPTCPPSAAGNACHGTSEFGMPGRRIMPKQGAEASAAHEDSINSANLYEA